MWQSSLCLSGLLMPTQPESCCSIFPLSPLHFCTFCQPPLLMISLHFGWSGLFVSHLPQLHATSSNHLLMSCHICVSDHLGDGFLWVLGPDQEHQPPQVGWQALLALRGWLGPRSVPQTLILSRHCSTHANPLWRVQAGSKLMDKNSFSFRSEKQSL